MGAGRSTVEVNGADGREHITNRLPVNEQHSGPLHGLPMIRLHEGRNHGWPIPPLHPPQPPSTVDGYSLFLLIHAPCDVERVEAHATSENHTFRLNIILRILAKGHVFEAAAKGD